MRKLTGGELLKVYGGWGAAGNGSNGRKGGSGKGHSGGRAHSGGKGRSGSRGKSGSKGSSCGLPAQPPAIG